MCSPQVYCPSMLSILFVFVFTQVMMRTALLFYGMMMVSVRIMPVTSRLPPCDDSYLVAWRQLPPYTEMLDDSAGGILLDIFKTGMRSCCIAKTNRLGIVWELTHQYDIDHLISNETIARSIHFLLPLQRHGSARRFLEHPYVPIVTSPGFALLLKPPENSLSVLVRALKPVFPVLVVSLMAMAIAGVVFWMIENMTIAWNGGTPERFTPGVWNGVWWAFISMTTIGYGDVIPKTKAGKTFSVLWVLMGIVLCGVLVSSISSVLIEALSPKTLSLMNKKVGVLHASEEYRYAFKSQAITEQFDTIRDISTALKQGDVSMALIDILVASQYQEEFKEFVLDRVIEHLSSNGVVFFPRGMKYSSCIHEYILNSQREIINNVSMILKGDSYKSYTPVSASSIIDPSLLEVQYTLVGMLLLMVVCITCAMVKQTFATNKKDFGFGETEKILKEVKKMYSRELLDLTDALREKCRKGIKGLDK